MSETIGISDIDFRSGLVAEGIIHQWNFPAEVIMLADYLVAGEDYEGAETLLSRFEDVGELAIDEAILAIHAVVSQNIASHLQQPLTLF